MYYRLNSIHLDTIQESRDNFNILSEVVDSGMSYQNPILVHTSEELDIWFGKSFSSRDYFKELLDSGLVLYLYKPISDEIVLKEGEDYIDYDNFPVAVKSYEDFVADNNNTPLENILYVGRNGEKYIWYDSDWLNVKYLPQNLSDISKSLDNRDRVLITVPDSAVSYSYPDYTEADGIGVYSISSELIADDNSSLDYERIESEFQTLALDLKCDSQISNGFAILPVMNERVLFYKGDKPSISKVPTREYQSEVSINSYEDIVDEFSKYEDTYTILHESLDTYTIVSKIPIDDFYYTDGFKGDGDIPKLSITPNTKITWLEITNGIIQDEEVGIQIWSKTVGCDLDTYDSEKYIKVTIEEGTLDNYYRFIIKRYSYEEVFEGTLYPELGENRIDVIINSKSKLINCEFKNISGGLRLGTYTLKGAETENNNSDMFLKSLNTMFDFEKETIYPDFVLVPDIEKFGSELTESGYYKVLDRFLEISNDYHTQFVIENTPENYTFNLREPDNRLLYFLGDMELETGYYRPSYYVYIRSIFNDEYSSLSGDVLYYYNTFNPYVTEDEEVLYEKYKSNFLTFNNYSYYYKKYFNGSKYNTTGLMRFVMGKVYREFQKNKWSILGSRTILLAKSEIRNILNTIESRFSIVDQIMITGIENNLSKNSLSAEVHIYVNDLVDNDIKLDITINYSTN